MLVLVAGLLGKILAFLLLLVDRNRLAAPLTELN
jgi:hypothetical protein